MTTLRMGMWDAIPPAAPPLIPGFLYEAPEGVELRRTDCGLGLVATRSFTAGSRVLGGTPSLIDDEAHCIPVRVRIDGNVEQVDITSTQSVRVGRLRHIRVPDHYMNHSCDANSYTVWADDGFSYEQIAGRDIESGEEITCDYVLYEWDCDGHSFDCMCGALRCRGRISGFQGLPPGEQVELLPLTHPWIRMQMEQHRAAD